MKYLILILIFLTSCDYATLLFPNEIDTEGLAIAIPDVFTPKYNIPVVVDPNAIHEIDDLDMLARDIDARLDLYCDCAFTTDCQFRLKRFRIAIVPSGKFNCGDARGSCPLEAIFGDQFCECSGLIIYRLNTIFVSYTDLFKEQVEGFPINNELLPLLEHEWAHGDGTLKSDHSNSSEIIDCIFFGRLPNDT